ncbi:L-2-hydroxyglutarate oxidase [Sphingobacterium lumbrici]|uniref:L-2-hydroxyglutarate oxidase n=1 Tax=Sphingobacterium lumbrici TaxID=2559600 RepID=UPI001C125424|nr:L-2-hydroxyglutarate oxidase [Sphingobacterium lumbrici]
MMTKFYDIIVVGAGLVGLSTAYHLKLKYPDKSLLVLEKENQVSKHQSGNNSGVIHSGIYYRPGSLKAQNCINGYHSLIAFADQYDIPYDICGKIIVASDSSELTALENIYSRGVQNGLTTIRKLNQEQLGEYEPHVAGVAGLHAPQTGIIDYPAMAKQLQILITEELGGDIRFSEEVRSIKTTQKQYAVTTSKEAYLTEKIVTCAGLQSDRVANLTGDNNDLQIIPFRGEYYKLRPEKEYLVNNLIYPVPNPEFPFLGVHFTRMINGGVEAGPNAVLAFKREGYKFSDINLTDLSQTLTWPGFWKIVMKYGKTGMMEMYRSLSKSSFTKSLQKLIPEVQEKDLIDGGAGVRAQACDRNGNLIDDFNMTEGNNIIHVRNAPSPAATSCLSIGKLISEKI